MQPPYQAGAHHQEAEEAAGMAEDEVLSPRLFRLAETSPHADTAETVAPPPASIGHQCNDGRACSSAQHAAAGSVHPQALPDGEGLLTEEQPDREEPGSQLPGACWASAATVSPEAGPSRSAAPLSADLPVPQARRGHASSNEAPHPADLPVSRVGRGHASSSEALHPASFAGSPARRSHASNDEAQHPADLPVPCATRRDPANSMQRRSTATAGQSRAQSHDGRASPVAHSLPGVSLPVAHGVMHHRAVLASPGRAESGSPNPSMAADRPGSSAQRHQPNDSRDAQLQQRLRSDTDAELAGVVDSFVGAIVQEGSDDEGDGEVVEERGMFQQCYKGHCNLTQNKEVMLPINFVVNKCSCQPVNTLCWVCLGSQG